MSLETAADARRIAGLSRAEYDRLLAYLEQLPPDGWTEPSACSDWQVYQVVSHIGSQPQIHRGVVEAGLRGAPPQTDEQRRAIWAYFDGLEPDQVLAEFRRTNEAYIKLIESLTDDELGRTIPWIAGPAPLATVLAGRLNEQVLHSWDIRWARDRQAALTAEAVPTLLELDLAPGYLGRLAKPERAPSLAGQTIELRHSRPDGAVSLAIEPDGLKASPGRAAVPDLTAELPAEAAIRFVWGRYDVPAGLRSGQLELSRPERAEALRALFPGR